jgi:hypothetical protein
MIEGDSENLGGISAANGYARPGFRWCKCDAVDDGNAELAAIARRRGERVKSVDFADRADSVYRA